MAGKSKKQSYVISLRVSAQERKELREIMSSRQIRLMSELMRQAVELVKKNGPQCMARSAE